MVLEPAAVLPVGALLEGVVLAEVLLEGVLMLEVSQIFPPIVSGSHKTRRNENETFSEAFPFLYN